MADSFEEAWSKVGDVEMGEEIAVEVDPKAAADEGVPVTEAAEEETLAEGSGRVPFTTYLESPVVTLIVGAGPSQTALNVHQALLTSSPFFAEYCASFADDGSPRQVELASDDIDAVGCFLEYLYTGEYFPQKIPGARSLETDASIPKVDEDGEQLLKHARVYTLAEKFALPQLGALASSKIHCVNSTARGEVAYARYVYAYTSKDDKAIRDPITRFWAHRSHTLRAEAEDEFKALCLEYPQFGYDVLTRVLDEKLKRETNSKMHPSSTGSVRKRPRHSSVRDQTTAGDG